MVIIRTSLGGVLWSIKPPVSVTRPNIHPFLHHYWLFMTKGKNFGAEMSTIEVQSRSSRPYLVTEIDLGWANQKASPRSHLSFAWTSSCPSSRRQLSTQSSFLAALTLFYWPIYAPPDHGHEQLGSRLQASFWKCLEMRLNKKLLIICKQRFFYLNGKAKPPRPEAY